MPAKKLSIYDILKLYKQGLMSRTIQFTLDIVQVLGTILQKGTEISRCTKIVQYFQFSLQTIEIIIRFRFCLLNEANNSVATGQLQKKATSCVVVVRDTEAVTTASQQGYFAKDLDRSWVSSLIKVHILGRKWLECSLCSTPGGEQ